MNTRLQPLGPGFDSRVICELSLCLVLFSAPTGFSQGTPIFPSPQKPTFPNSNLILEFTRTCTRTTANNQRCVENISLRYLFPRKK